MTKWVRHSWSGSIYSYCIQLTHQWLSQTQSLGLLLFFHFKSKSMDKIGCNWASIYGEKSKSTEDCSNWELGMSWLQYIGLHTTQRHRGEHCIEMECNSREIYILKRRTKREKWRKRRRRACWIMGSKSNERWPWNERGTRSFVGANQHKRNAKSSAFRIQCNIFPS